MEGKFLSLEDIELQIWVDVLDDGDPLGIFDDP